jgi:hypothetical protein
MSERPRKPKPLIHIIDSASTDADCMAIREYKVQVYDVKHFDTALFYAIWQGKYNVVEGIAQ